MLPNHWYAIYDATKLTAKKPVAMRRLNQDLVAWRDAVGTARLSVDRCPHRGTKLSAGSIEDGCLTCPYHGFRFETDGTCVHIPASPNSQIPSQMKLATIPVQEDHGLIWMWWGDQEPSPNVPWLNNAPSADSPTAQASELVYPIHYSRMVESNFDLHHFPFVHSNIAGNLPTEVTNIEVNHGEDWITSTAYLGEKDDKKGFRFDSNLKLPNVQVLTIDQRFHIVTIATPIDDTTTWTWARLELLKPNLPFGKKLASKLALKTEFGYIQYRQDIPVLEPMTPATAQPGSSTFIAADAGAARYVSLRQRALKQAGVPEERFIQPHPHPSASTPIP